MHTDLDTLVAHIKSRFEANHFSHYLGLELVEVSLAGAVTIALPVRLEHSQNVGFVHGGILATLADVAMGFAALAAAPRDHHVLTGELKISYLNPGLGERIYAQGYAIKPGRRLVFTEAEVYAEQPTERYLIAKASATMVVVNKEDLKPKD